MEKSRFINSDEVARELGISKSFAFKIIREMNSELKSQGFLVLQGKVSRAYFEEKIYG